MSQNELQLGDVALHSYKYKGDTYIEYVMYRRDASDLTIARWYNGQGEVVAPSAAVQPLPSPEELHATFGLPDPFAYIPRLGDVATYPASSGAPVTVTYRRNDQSPFASPQWYQANGVQALNAHLTDGFKLLIRDGQVQS